MIFWQVLHALAPRRNWVVRLHLAQPAQNVVFFWFPDADASAMTSEASPGAAHVIFRQVLHALAPRRNWVVRLHLAQPAQNVVFFSFWQASSRDTPFSETAADSAGSVVSVFRHLHIPLCFSPATAGFLHSVVSSVSTVAAASTMGAGGWYVALGYWHHRYY